MFDNKKPVEYYRTYAETDLSAIEHNLKELKKKIDDGARVLAVVKADAYGHGAVKVALDIQNEVDYFAIAELGEALELRRAGITKPVLILSYTSPFQYEAIIANNITQTVFNYDDAVAISKTAQRLEKTAIIHIAVDTGMSRIGFFCNSESADIVKKISKLPNITVEGLFSHFACADSRDRESVNSQQERFADFIKMLEARGVYIPIKHICNSAGLLTGCKQYDMVRLGIIMYGLYPEEWVNDGSVDLKPAMRIVSHITHIKELPEGTGVSYGHTYFTKGKTRVATVCIGYADGYQRSLSNKGRVLINGEFAPIIGRVCMDQLMVDVTKLKKAAVGDEVTILGSDGENKITPEELAGLTDTINYEVICQFQKRVAIVHIKK